MSGRMIILWGVKCDDCSSYWNIRDAMDAGKHELARNGRWDIENVREPDVHFDPKPPAKPKTNISMSLEISAVHCATEASSGQWWAS